MRYAAIHGGVDAHVFKDTDEGLALIKTLADRLPDGLPESEYIRIFKSEDGHMRLTLKGHTIRPGDYVVVLSPTNIIPVDKHIFQELYTRADADNFLVFGYRNEDLTSEGIKEMTSALKQNFKEIAKSKDKAG